LVQCARPAQVRNLELHSILTPPVLAVEVDNLPPITFSSISRTRSNAICSRTCRNDFLFLLSCVDGMVGVFVGGLIGVLVSIQE
jgi:hypothetical protein